MKRPKGASPKGYGNPVTESPVRVEPDEHGTRAQRRLWRRLYGRTAPTVPQKPTEGSAS